MKAARAAGSWAGEKARASRTGRGAVLWLRPTTRRRWVSGVVDIKGSRGKRLKAEGWRLKRAGENAKCEMRNEK